MKKKQRNRFSRPESAGLEATALRQAGCLPLHGARDTVEEKILLLQNRKREIIQATIGGEEEFAAALNWEEIQELLA